MWRKGVLGDSVNDIPTMENSMDIPQNTTISTATLGYMSKKMKREAPRAICTSIFIAESFTIAKM